MNILTTLSEYDSTTTSARQAVAVSPPRKFPYLGERKRRRRRILAAGRRIFGFGMCWRWGRILGWWGGEVADAAWGGAERGGGALEEVFVGGDAWGGVGRGE